RPGHTAKRAARKGIRELPTKPKRKQWPEIRLLVPRLSVKAQLDKIIGSCAPLNEAARRQGCHLRGKGVRRGAGELDPCYLAQTRAGTQRRLVLNRDTVGALRKRKIKQHRLSQHVCVRPDMEV